MSRVDPLMSYEPKNTVWLDPDGKTLRFGRESAKGTPDGVAVGECYVEVDGYWVWVPPDRQGCWESPSLRLVADFLDESNAEWDAKIQKFFEEERKKPSSGSAHLE
jgi:hypothetical protein